MEAATDPLPLGVSGRLEVLPLHSASGEHAALVRDDGQPRALLSASPGPDGRERIVVMPLDEEVEVRIDGDALAVWLASGSLSGPAAESLPGWASALGLLLVLVLAGLAILGSATLFSWLIGP